MAREDPTDRIDFLLDNLDRGARAGDPARLRDAVRALRDALRERDDAHRRAEAALRESEERFRAFVTASSDVVYRMSPDWRELRQLRGREFIPDTDSPNRAWIDKYIHPDDQARVLAAVEAAIRTKSLFELEHRVRRVDGTLGWTFSRAVPILDANGGIVEWVGTAKDITDRKRAEAVLRESREKYQALIETTGEFIWEVDARGRYTYCSPQMETLWGLKPDPSGSQATRGRSRPRAPKTPASKRRRRRDGSRP